MSTNKDLNKNNNHSEWTDWYLQDIGNVKGLISCRLSTIPITNLIRLVMAKANISKPMLLKIEKLNIKIEIQRQ